MRTLLFLIVTGPLFSQTCPTFTINTPAPTVVQLDCRGFAWSVDVSTNPPTLRMMPRALRVRRLPFKPVAGTQTLATREIASNPSTSLMVYRNGLLLSPGDDYNYAVIANVGTITLVTGNVPTDGTDTFVVIYTY